MKKLQSNFTTPEQSKKLLKLGVPADSADMFWSPTYLNGKKDGYLSDPVVINEYDIQHGINWRKTDAFPCWSVGRLVEIYELCTPYLVKDFEFTGTYIERLCKAFLFSKEMNELDFSKLEE